MITRVSFFICLLCVALVNAKSNRIVGGDKATSAQFKYQVSVQINNDHLCGGAIIDDRYVLTAAHCVADHDGNFYQASYQVVVDSIDLSGHGVRINVEKIYVPTKFLSRNKSHDIAVLKLSRGVGLGSDPDLEKVNLPGRGEFSPAGETLDMSGFGYKYVEVRNNPHTGEPEEINGQRDGKLRYVKVKIMSDSVCSRQNPYEDIGMNRFCGQAVQRKGKPAGVCTGDSGGPLVRGNTIVGVLSHSPVGCNEQVLPGIYTRVSSFITFIEKAMQDAKSSSILTVRDIHSCAGSSRSK